MPRTKKRIKLMVYIRSQFLSFYNYLSPDKHTRVKARQHLNADNVHSESHPRGSRCQVQTFSLKKIDNNHLILCETDFNISIGDKVYNHISIRACDPIRVGNSEVIKTSFATKSS